MKRTLAFVLAGGGAKAALQVGTLRALCEAGIHPDLLVGSSARAINTAFLGLHGFTLAALDQLEAARFDVHLIELTAESPVPVWGFSHTLRLIETGYRQMKSALSTGKATSPLRSLGWPSRLQKWLDSLRHAIRRNNQAH